MPRVVPSQVVHLIEQLFPYVSTGTDSHVSSDKVAELTAISSLAREIPSELLALDGRDYGDYALALGAIEHSLKGWISRGPRGFLERAKGTNPLILLHRVLAKCPDQAPSPSTATLSFVTDAALRESVRRDISAANQDLVNGEWKGATILAGSAIEALLLWAIQDANQKKSGTISQAVSVLTAAGTLSQKPNNDPERWDLHEYIEVALQLALINDGTAKQARLAKDFRNLIHPGRSARLGQVCNRGTALSALSALEFVVRDLTP